jgi:putative DNA primase/helicase
VDESAESVVSHDACVVAGWRPVGSARGGSLLQGPVVPVGVVVVEVFGEDGFEVASAGDEQPVGAFAADAADPTFDITGEASRCAKAMVSQMRKEAEAEPTKQTREQMLGAVERAESAYGIRAMLELAGTESEVALAPTDLDAHPLLLNCRNGVLDLETGELREHDPALHLTKVTAASYDPEAEASLFVEFLERVQPDKAMREFLARLGGHALEGRITEHILAIFYGLGANGKTTLTEIIRKALGDYADATDPALLIDRGSEVHPTGVADLFGLRLALTYETNAGRRLAEGTVKRLTGGDRIKARRMREDFWSFDPSHSIVMSTNHKPIIVGTDEGIWRRLRLVPFDVVVPEGERDPKLPERLETETDGILAWLVCGHRAWRDRGLADPAAVTAATAAFRRESDMLALFIAEKCLTLPHLRVGSTELFEAWVAWCQRENVGAGTQKAFSQDMEKRGFDKKRGTGGAVRWLGIGLYVDETAAQ